MATVFSQSVVKRIWLTSFSGSDSSLYADSPKQPYPAKLINGLVSCIAMRLPKAANKSAGRGMLAQPLPLIEAKQNRSNSYCIIFYILVTFPLPAFIISDCGKNIPALSKKKRLQQLPQPLPTNYVMT